MAWISVGDPMRILMTIRAMNNQKPPYDAGHTVVSFYWSNQNPSSSPTMINLIRPAGRQFRVITI